MRAWLVGWLSEEHLLIGAGLARVLLGAWAVYYYALFWRDRHFLWGPDGIIPFARFADSMPFLNVLALNPSPFYFDVVYVAAMVIHVAFMFLTPFVSGRACARLRSALYPVCA